MRIYVTKVLAALCCAVFVISSSVHAELKPGSSADNPRVRQNFDAGWSFEKGDHPGADQPGFDQSQWRKLDLPHDWSIEGPYNELNPSGARGAYLPCGIGWYRKSFKLPADTDGRMVFIEFDGIYMNGEVWINGHRLGKRPYGYIGVEYDLTPHLKLKGDNVLAVRVDNSLQPSSRWYTGSGIYRHVWLTLTDKLRVAHWGTQISTPAITAEQAEVVVKTTMRNGYDHAKQVIVTQNIIDAAGRSVASTVSRFKLEAPGGTVVSQTLKIDDPLLWSPESPNLYTVRTELRDGKLLVDNYETTLGVREVIFDANKGMLLNGKSIIMKGMCNHHDLGPLGTAMWDQALERRLRMLKDMGCNAIRTSHNPPSLELLDMCNRMGFLVIDETFDEWRRGFFYDYKQKKLVASKKNKGKARKGYHLYFDEWAERDLIDHITRDRNHPSVVLWSVGNEVPESLQFGEIETVKQLQKISHKFDPTRLVTVGCCSIQDVNESGFAEQLDAVGYNGGGGSCFQYEADHKQYPDRIMYASEVPHSLQTRGEYRTHTRYRARARQPAHLTEKEVFPETDVWYESSYDNAGVRISAFGSWHLTKTLPYIAGEFRWTGFDYLGESGGWPRVLGNFGIIDICNFPKDTYYFYQSQWTQKPMVHILPHWTWTGKEGTTIPVWCYSNCDSVELFLNNKSLGEKKITEKMEMRFEWPVVYTPGELKAVARKDGAVVATEIVKTASQAASFSLTPDKAKLELSGRDLSYVTIRIEDESGNFVPTADNWVTFEVEGPGKLQALANGDPMSHDNFQGRSVRAFNGLALVIVVPTGEDGRIVLTASSKRMEPVELTIIAGNPPPEVEDPDVNK